MTHTKKRWADDETKKLIEMWSNNRPIKEISVELKREEAVIRAKVSSLRKKNKTLRKKLKIRGFPKYVLDEANVKEIRLDERTLEAIGKTHGVSPVTIYKIKNRLTWKNVK